MLLAVSLMCLGLTACNSPLAELQGHYEGTLFQRTDGNGRQQPVRADILVDSKGRGKVAITDLENTSLLNIDLTEIKDQAFKITIPGLVRSPMEVVEKAGCYLRKGDQALRFCLARGELVLEVTTKEAGSVFTLALDRFKKVDEYVMEKPAKYTLSQSIDIAFKMNFDNRIEFEHVKQARLTRSYTRKNLLPGLSLGSLVSLIVLDPASIISSIGDLAPFLLPTRWLQASEAGLRTQAEEDALILLRADTAMQIEGFAYILQRDRTIQAFYADTLEKAKGAQDLIEAREDVGLYPRGTSDDIKSVVNGIEQASVALDLAVKEDLTAIAQTMGFHNPDAIAEFTLESELESIDHCSQIPIAESKARKALKRTVIERSFEIRQIDYLIKVSRLQKAERYFSWLDPAADPMSKLGLGIADFIKVGGSQIDEMKLRREELQQTIETKIVNTVTEYNNALQAYALASAGMEIQNRRLTRILETVSLGTNVDMFGLVQIFQDYLSAENSIETDIAAYRVARAKRDRFLLKGHFSSLAQRPDPTGK